MVPLQTIPPPDNDLSQVPIAMRKSVPKGLLTEAALEKARQKFIRQAEHVSSGGRGGGVRNIHVCVTHARAWSRSGQETLPLDS